MKVISKYFKVALCFMAFALCSFMFAFTPTFTAVEAANLAITGYNVAINALKMPTEVVDYEKGDKFSVPLLSAGIGATADPTGYTIRVVDVAGYKHDYVVGGTNTDAFFGNVFTANDEDATKHSLIKDNKYLLINAKNDGEYKVAYIVTEGTGSDARTYHSNSYKVTVTNVAYELDFSTPVLDADKNIIGYTKNLIQTKLATSNEPYELPVAYAKISGSELSINETTGAVSNKVATIKVTKDGAPQELDEAGSIFTSDNDKYYITPSEEGVYTVEYTFEDSANRPTKTYTITVEDNYVASSLKLASTPTMPSVELGKKDIKLPKLSVNAGSEKNVDVNITSVVIEKEDDSNIRCELYNNNLTFSMTPEMFDDFYTGTLTYADMAGNYRVTYTVEGAAENQDLTETFKLDAVSISSKPSIKLSYNYDKTANNFQETVKLGAETELKAEYVSNNEFVLPAVYVEDAVTTNYSDFVIIRTIRKGSTYYYIDNKKYDEDTNSLVNVEATDKGYNNSGDTNIGNVGKAVKFKFNDNAENIEGTYYLEYRVITKQVKERESYLYVDNTNEKYSFKVVASHTATTPKIEITNLTDRAVKNTDAITVKVTATDELDIRVKSATFVYSSKVINMTESLEYYITKAIDDVQNATGYEKTSHIFEDARFITEMQKYYNDFEVVTESATKNSFDLDLSEKEDEITVVAVAINDDGKVATDSKVLTIKDTENKVAPEIKIYEAQDIWKDGNNIKEFQIGQGEEVKLPTVYVKDTDKDLSLNVMYYIDSPENSYGAIKYESPIGKKFYYDKTITTEEVQVIDGGKITTSKTGIYYVAYTATDVAGNTSVMYFTFEVVDTSKPVLTVEPTGDNIKQSGNTVEAGKGAVIDFEITLSSSDKQTDYTNYDNITIEIDDNGKGLDYSTSGKGRTSYVFNDYGTYIVTISGEYKTTINGSEKTLKADNKVIKVVIEKQEISWIGEFDVVEYASKNQEVKLPDIAASNDAVVSVSVKAPGGSAPTEGDAVKVTENGYTYWVFRTNTDSKGTYTVTYTATTDEDVLTKTFNIKVGDNVAPTLTFNKGELTQDIVYEGKDIEYVVEVNKSKKTFVVKAVNNGKEIYSYDIGLTIKDKDDTGSVNSNMSWTNLSYELVGDKVTTGTTTSNSTQYLIGGTGKYELKLTIKDSYDNTRTEIISFNVVTKSNVKENKDTVIGAVLIVISLILLAGVILFFTFTGKKGGNGSKTKTVKTTKKEQKVETEEVKEEAIVEEVTTEAEKETEETAEVEEKVEDEPKTGDVE